ncbi:hypothetical protein C8Q75DRAFT_766657 [Abortiporus biennis]|nr:hypothetical protein C8Q75DRAFT_766657 [Abortiporus biennis]
MSKLEQSVSYSLSLPPSPPKTINPVLLTSNSTHHVQSTPLESSTSAQSQTPAPATPLSVQNGQNPAPSRPPERYIPIPDIEAIVNDCRKQSREKGRTVDEEVAMSSTAARIATQLASDHKSVLYPDVETPFKDAVDVVKRLLPYHVFQQPADDLNEITVRAKGKRKATEEDILRQEIADTKFAIECWKRRAAIEKRFKRIRINSGKRVAPDDQAYVLAQAVLEADRFETANMNAEVRLTRQELDRVEREKRAAAAAAAPPAPTQTARSSYYQPPAAISAYPAYRGYTYAYGQGYGTQYQFAPYSAGSNAAATYNAYSRTSSYTQPTSFSGQGGASTTRPPANNTTASTPATPTAPSSGISLAAMAPIPVLLPSSSLTALSALGIVPVPVANLPAAGQPQPAAVLKGTTQNGTMVSLEINVQSLQANQMSGLAYMLSALTSRGMNVDGTATPGGSTSGGGSQGTSVTSGSGGGSGNGAPSSTVDVSASSNG